jgi:hypothetical protein
MAYSRWATSTWYTFWSASETNENFTLPTKKRKDSQSFEICDIPGLTIKYGDIKQFGLDAVVDGIRAYYSVVHDGSGFDWDVTTGQPIYKAKVSKPKNPSAAEIDELVSYLKDFIRDVDIHYKLIPYFKHYWYIPFKNKLRYKLKNLI